MRFALASILIFGVAAANAAIPDSKSPKGDWDDDDSMILPSTTSKDSYFNVPQHEKDTINLEDKPHFISLIPTSDPVEQENENLQGTGQENQPRLESLPRDLVPPPPPSENKPATAEFYTSTTSQDSNEDADSKSSETSSTTEGSGLHFVQLGKIPLTFEIIPLASSSSDEYFNGGKSHLKPVGFFPEQVSGDVMLDKALRQEQAQQQQSKRQTNEEDSYLPQRQAHDETSSDEPATYLTPPKEDEQSFWRQYPLETDSDFNKKETDTMPQSTYNPLLERLNAFLQKAKRQLEEQKILESTPQEPEELETSSGATRETSASTPEDDGNDDDDNESSSPSSINEDSGSSEEMTSTPSTIPPYTPRYQDPLSFINVPARQDQPKFQPTSPYWINAVSPAYRQSNDYFPKYNNFVNREYYSNPDIGIMTSMQPPPKSFYSPSSFIDSYLPQRYSNLYETNNNAYINRRNLDYYPFMRYATGNDYYQPESNNLIESNSIQDDIDLGRPDYSRYGYGSENRQFYPRGRVYNAPLPYSSDYPYYSPSYMSYRRPAIPARSYRSYYSSPELVSNYQQYAPLYPYRQSQQYNQFQPQPEFF